MNGELTMDSMHQMLYNVLKNKNSNDMENKIIELLRKNRIGKEKAIYLAHELLFLFSDVGRSEQLVCDNCNGTGGEKFMNSFYPCNKCKGSG